MGDVEKKIDVEEKKMNNEEKKLDNNSTDNHIFVTDDEGKKYRAEVFDIFKVEGYEDNEYIMYSFGESVDNSNERVYISKVVEADDDSYNLTEISDEKEWDAVNKTIQSNLESLGEDND